MNLHLIAWAIAALALGFGGGVLLGYSTGHDAGKLQLQGEHDKARADQLQNVVDTVKAQQAKGLDDSRAMRVALTKLERRDTVTTQELKDALKKSKPDRVQCLFDANSMRIISAAADTADALAAGGIRGSVSAGNPADGQQR